MTDAVRSSGDPRVRLRRADDLLERIVMLKTDMHAASVLSRISLRLRVSKPSFKPTA